MTKRGFTDMIPKLRLNHRNIPVHAFWLTKTKRKKRKKNKCGWMWRLYSQGSSIFNGTVLWIMIPANRPEYHLQVQRCLGEAIIKKSLVDKTAFASRQCTCSHFITCLWIFGQKQYCNDASASIFVRQGYMWHFPVY